MDEIITFHNLDCDLLTFLSRETHEAAAMCSESYCWTLWQHSCRRANCLLKYSAGVSWRQDVDALCCSVSQQVGSGTKQKWTTVPLMPSCPSTSSPPKTSSHHTTPTGKLKCSHTSTVLDDEQNIFSVQVCGFAGAQWRFAADIAHPPVMTEDNLFLNQRGKCKTDKFLWCYLNENSWCLPTVQGNIPVSLSLYQLKVHCMTISIFTAVDFLVKLLHCLMPDCLCFSLSFFSCALSFFLLLRPDSLCSGFLLIRILIGTSDQRT